MVNIIVFSQNLKLEWFDKKVIPFGLKNIVITTQELFPFEINRINSIIGECEYYTFADFLNDSEMNECEKAGLNGCKKNLDTYYQNIKTIKNHKIAEKVLNKWNKYRGYLLSDNNDLGIDNKVWTGYGFRKIPADYYFHNRSSLRSILAKIKPLKSIYHMVKPVKMSSVYKKVYVSEYQGRKIVFIGSMNRIAYRMSIDFVLSKDERQRLIDGRFETKERCQYISTLHECGQCVFLPESSEYDVKYIQDGYLPPNYSNFYLMFKPDNVSYYAWDKMGEEIFKNQDIEVDIMPYRKKLYMPEPNFSPYIKKVLIAMSGPGDWTAMKNRSDDDRMLKLFIAAAERFPGIQFVYRCHPTWIHPTNAGVNSINRAVLCIEKSGLKNIRVSSNIPSAGDFNNFKLSFERSSLENDLNGADIVFGEHSASMIDAAFEKIPFCSVNPTNRRNFAVGLTELGFPHCENIDELIDLFEKFNSKDFRDKYDLAVKKYNQMTDIEDQTAFSDN